MTLILLMVLAMLLLVAAGAEVLSGSADQLFSSLCREDSYKEALQKTRKDTEAAVRKSETLGASLPPVRQELARAKGALADLEREYQERQKTPELLIFAPDLDAERRDNRRRTTYRAVVSKRLGDAPEATQALLWRRSCFIEIVAGNPAEAMVEAKLRYPAAQGYTIGPFTEALPVATAAPVAPAASPAEAAA
jgi:hypothetical protein